MSVSEKQFLRKTRPLAKKLIAYALAAGKPFGISDVKISISASEKQENTIEQGDVAMVVAGSSWHVGVTLYAGDRVLSFRKNTLDEGALQNGILKNMQVIHLVPPNPHHRLLEADKIYKGKRIDLDLRDKNPPDQKTLIAFALAAEAAALAEPGVKTAESVTVSKSNSHYFVLATNGLDYHESATACSAYAAVIAEDASGMQSDGESSVARHFSDLGSAADLGKTAARNTVSKLGASLPATRKMPIVLDHAAAAAFFGAVYAAIDGAAVYRGSTFLKGKIGQQVMSKGVTLVDDPGIPRGIASLQVDSAGMKADKITFIENGVLKVYNAGLVQSRQLGIAPIGRDGGSTNSSILPGSQTPDELIADIDDGIYIKGFNGGTVDVNNGNHSRQAYGTLIKNGKITNIAVEGFVVSGNLKDMFMNVALANDTPALPSTKYTLSAPTTRINGVTIAGK